jgi:cytochrome c oxidase subunit IV
MVMIGIVMLAMSPIFIAVFGRKLWEKLCAVIWNAMVHPAGPVVVFPAGWRRTVIRMVRPSRKEMPLPEKHVS